MRVNLAILIGNKPYGFASKTIDLDFAPVPGMTFGDGTWKGAGTRTIKTVCIEIHPENGVSLCVALDADESDPLDALKPIYESHGWEIM